PQTLIRVTLHRWTPSGEHTTVDGEDEINALAKTGVCFRWHIPVVGLGVLAFTGHPPSEFEAGVLAASGGCGDVRGVVAMMRNGDSD
ncbi:hypothetical protein Tco_1501149, partial [Tanacetum coccineum]